MLSPLGVADVEPEPGAARARGRDVRGRQARRAAAPRGARVRADRRRSSTGSARDRSSSSSEAEELALPAFERHQAGVVVSLAGDRRGRPPTTVDVELEEIRLPAHAGTSSTASSFPAHVLDRMEAIGRAAVDPARADPLRASATTASRSRPTPATVVAADVSAVAAHLAGRDGRAATPARRRPARGGGGRMTTLTFFGWWRPPGAAAVSSGALDRRPALGRAAADRERLDHPSDSATRTLAYDLFGPGDVTGLAPAAVVHTYPSPGAQQRRDRQGRLRRARRAGPAVAPHGRPAARQGAAPVDRPARRHGRRDRGRRRRPSRLQPSVLDAHPLGRLGARRARRAGRRPAAPIARLISPRALDARPRPRRGDRARVHRRGHAGVGDPGRRRRSSSPLYHHWTFHTRAGGDFATLARRLKLRAGRTDLGSADVEYGPLPAAAATPVRGALVSTTDAAAGAAAAGR